MKEELTKKYDEYMKGNVFFVMIMLGLTLLNVPLRILGVTRFYFSFVFSDMITDLGFRGSFVVAILVLAALIALTVFTRKKHEMYYIIILGILCTADLVFVLVRENHLNYILSIFAHLWVIYTFIALIILKYKLRRIS